MKRKLFVLALLSVAVLGITACHPKTEVPTGEESTLSDSKASENTTVEEAEEIRIRAQFAEKVKEKFDSYEEFTASDVEPQVRILFQTNRPVKDFKFLNVQVENIDENGTASFSHQELYTLNELTPKRPLIVTLTFYGDLPNNGFSYVDEKGQTRYFTLELSGKGDNEDDGILLTEFETPNL